MMENWNNEVCVRVCDWALTLNPHTTYHSNIPIFQYSNIPVFQYSNIPVFQYSSIPVFQYSSIPIIKYYYKSITL